MARAADGASVTFAVLTGALRLAAESWRGQLVVLVAGALLLGGLLDTAGLGRRPLEAVLVATLGFTVLLAASVRAAHTREEAIDGGVLVDELVALLGLLPRLLAQVFTVAAVPAAGVVFALQAAGLHPLLGLVLLPGTFLCAILALPLALLATVAVVVGDRRWLPASAWRALRAQPLQLVAASLVGWLVAALAAMPLALSGMVVAAVAGPLGLVGTGITTVAGAPLLGCVAVSLWRRCGAQPAQHEAGEATAAPTATDVAGRFAAASASWVAGPAWDVAVDAGAVWGTWIRMEAPATVAFRLQWSGQVPPQLALAAEDGTWTMPEQVATPGGTSTVTLPAGNTYVQVGSRDVAAQSISIAMLVAATSAAA